MSNLISVIMPYHNKKKYFQESINSVFNQTYKDWEVIIIGDGSNDNNVTEKICKLFV